MDNRLKIRLIDMREYASKAIELLGEADLDSFITNEHIYFSVIKCVETVGEAAAQAKRENLEKLDDTVPWVDVIGMRNILVHEYSGISASTVFDTVKHSLPNIISVLNNLLEDT